MIHMMEEDSSSSIPHSLRSRRQIPMNPGKRARSPEGSSPADRPSKRPSLAVGGITRRPDYRHLSLGSASSSLGTPEDWVQQAGGLSIDSPIPSDLDNPFVGGGDVDMMDSEDSSVNELPGRTQTSHFSNTGPSQQGQQQPVLVPQTSHPCQHEDPAGFGRTPGRRVSVPPPSTPPPSSPDLMAISPTTSLTQTGSSRRRVVFGPRANCDKCRLGAPGHFIHYE
ncbi:hypothetical protein M413DRAFT_438597 [Hebeloma cylindrosporum]|uniref:Uncharacterized protein n=1 Tax=Hebeloma cylindrosporum TaxID=76867 RepID=A0A0C2Z8E7_HEBCY|nr:hypothetical protein M413DRAFT_438597 [Hebeloma cylindrosporum h7]